MQHHELQNESLQDERHGVLNLDQPRNGGISSRSSSPTTRKGKEVAEVQEEPPVPPPSTSSSSLGTMSIEAAKELDEAVVKLNAAYAVEDVTVLPMSTLYAPKAAAAAAAAPPAMSRGNGTIATNATEPAAASLLPPLSRPEHYRNRIGRDLRHLAVTIASATETPEQWRAFCQEGGGLYPLLETVREGAARLRAQVQLGKDERDESDVLLVAACHACRALRDVAAISPEVAAVLTDGVLRANAAWEGGLLSGLTTCLTFARDFSESGPSSSTSSMPSSASSARWTSSKQWIRSRRRDRREARLRSRLYIHQLLLAMTCASDDAVNAIRETPGLSDAILACSSFARKEQTRRWLRYPGELVKYLWQRAKGRRRQRGPFLEAANIGDDLNGQVQKTANLVLAAIGRNHWVPKSPTQRGLRILCLDGGGSRGMASVTALQCLMEFIGEGINVEDAFDILGGTSTGGIISFLTGLRGETCAQAAERYNQLIKQIFVKSALSTPRLFLTTASYDESHFMEILSKILVDDTMLDSRADPRTPLVFCVTSKMSSTPTHVALFRNYNYAAGELADHFTIDPKRAREEVGIPLDLEHQVIRKGRYAHRAASVSSPGVRTSDGSRHPGSFRVLQRYALRASTAAPTVFKPVMMGGEMYCDGGIVASNPTAIAIHEARTLFPDVPIEMVISIGTGGFLEQKNSPRIGWDGIIGQIVNSACDAEQIHHILEDILGDPCVLGRGSSVSRTRYYRFNPVLGPPDQFPIDVTDPEKLAKLRQITLDYMNEPAQQAKMRDIAGILTGRNRWNRWISR
jgi:predicted acylesterase/phospholipase RssA